MLVEEGSEALRLERCRGDDDAQLRPRPASSLQQACKQVRGQRPLVRLVQHDHGVAPQKRVCSQLAEQKAISDVSDHRGVAGDVLEAGSVAHRAAKRDAHLLSDTCGERRCRDSSGLSNGYLTTACCPAGVMEVLRQLRRLARASFCNYN